MNHSFATPPPTLRGVIVRIWNDPDARSTAIGILGVLLIHLLLWLIAPHVFRFEPVAASVRTQATPKTFNIELAPETFTKPTPKPINPTKFVEANPDAPENIPDKTDNFSDRNQQVAQEKPTPDGASDRPATEGKKDFDSTQIVSGQLTKPIEHMEAVPPNEPVPEQPAATVPKAEQNPLPGFEKKDGDNKDAFGSNIAKFPDNARPIPDRIDGEKNVPLIQGATGNRPAIDPKRPQPRPQLVATQQVRPAILAENPIGTKNVGLAAYDAKWSAYGEYLKRLIETVQIEWERILISKSTIPPSGTFVSVRFVLTSEGKIQRFDVDNHSNPAGADACVSAITRPAPYREWTEDMKAMLGDQQELTFNFYYQ